MTKVEREKSVKRELNKVSKGVASHLASKGIKGWSVSSIKIRKAKSGKALGSQSSHEHLISTLQNISSKVEDHLSDAGDANISSLTLENRPGVLSGCRIVNGQWVCD